MITLSQTTSTILRGMCCRGCLYSQGAARRGPNGVQTRGAHPPHLQNCASTNWPASMPLGANHNSLKFHQATHASHCSFVTRAQTTITLSAVRWEAQLKLHLTRRTELRARWEAPSVASHRRTTWQRQRSSVNAVSGIVFVFVANSVNPT